MSENSDKLEKVVALAKRRGFIFPGSEIYGGLANSWDYGPLGAELKNNIKNLWWKKFVHSREDMVVIDPATIMNPKVWEASGHLKEFTDPLVECKKCHQRFRDNQIKSACPNCQNKEFSEAKQFNLLFKTFLGPAEDTSTTVYLRGELAQAMFVDFPLILQTARVRIPFGIAAHGKVFRNEITPGNFIFRTREFDLMEFEYFVRETEWEKWFEYWKKEMHGWLEDLGVNLSHIHNQDVPKEDLAHYSKKTIDIEYDYPFGRNELYGLAYRTDFDLKNHMEKSGQDMNYADPETGEKFIPHIVEPTFGLDRSFLVVLLESYYEDGDRIVLKLKPNLAPYKAAVFPLVVNKPLLVKKAREIFEDLKKNFNIAWDERGNIGKRYYSQDEIGTVFGITVDYQTIEDDTVTLRDRDTTKQIRVKTAELKEAISKAVEGHKFF